jgi:hypothetical protein
MTTWVGLLHRVNEQIQIMLLQQQINRILTREQCFLQHGYILEFKHNDNQLYNLYNEAEAFEQLISNTNSLFQLISTHQFHSTC